MKYEECMTNTDVFKYLYIVGYEICVTNIQIIILFYFVNFEILLLQELQPISVIDLLHPPFSK